MAEQGLGAISLEASAGAFSILLRGRSAGNLAFDFSLIGKIRENGPHVGNHTFFCLLKVIV